MNRTIPWSKAVIALVFTLCLMALVWCSFGATQDFDQFWHFAMGRDFLTQGLSPLRDHYSFTFPNSPIRGSSIPYQALLYLFEAHLGGLLGSQVFHSILLALALTLFGEILLRRRVSLPLATAAIVAFTGALIYRVNPRPELGSYSFALLMISVMISARRNLDFRALAILNGIFLVWNNYHHSSIVGYVLLGGLYAGMAIDLILARDFTTKNWSRIFGWGFVSLALGFCNPTFSNPLAVIATMSPEWNSMIQEYVGVPTLRLPMGNLIILVIAFLAIPTLLYQRYWAAALAIGALTFQSFKLAKMFPHLAVIATIFFFVAINELFQSRLQPRKERVLLLSALTLLTVACAIQLGANAWRARPLREYPNLIYPIGVAKKMKETGIKGNVLATYEAGSFLPAVLGTQIRTFIDGRTNILYPAEHMRLYYKIMAEPEAFLAVTSKWNVEYVVASIYQPSAALLETALSTGVFQVVYQDGGFVLLAKNGPFPATTALFHGPECWTSRIVADVRKEATEVEKTVPATSTFAAVVEIANKCTDQKSCAEYLKKGGPLVQRGGTGDQALRLAGFLSLRDGHTQAALSYLSLIADKRIADKMRLASAFSQLGKYNEAESLLTELSATKARAVDAALIEVKAKHAFSAQSAERCIEYSRL